MPASLSPGLKGEARIVATLDGVDWDFPGAFANDRSVHSLHWYPGNFMPQIPSFLIEILSEPGEVVFDPFCGSGTTGVESLLLGRIALQSDNNRVSVLISRAKMALLLSSAIERDLRAVAEVISFRLDARDPGQASHLEPLSKELDRWFHPETVLDLRAIWRAIHNNAHGEAAIVLRMLFSDLLFASVSPSPDSLRPGRKPRRHHWGWIADNVRPNGTAWQDARSLFLIRIANAIRVTESSVYKRIPGGSRQGIVRSDSRSVPLQSESIDLIVTSPPYLGMIDYARANRLTYAWYGWPLLTERKGEIGARYRRDGVNELRDYIAAIEICAAESHRVLRTGRYCAIVIGASRKFPDASAKVIQRFEAAGLRTVWGPVSRRLKRRRISDRLGSESEELICVFRKD